MAGTVLEMTLPCIVVALMKIALPLTKRPFNVPLTTVLERMRV